MSIRLVNSCQFDFGLAEEGKRVSEDLYRKLPENIQCIIALIVAPFAYLILWSTIVVILWIVLYLPIWFLLHLVGIELHFIPIPGA